MTDRPVSTTDPLDAQRDALHNLDARAGTPHDGTRDLYAQQAGLFLAVARNALLADILQALTQPVTPGMRRRAAAWVAATRPLEEPQRAVD
jgi:hypothetical protein